MEKNKEVASKTQIFSKKFSHDLSKSYRNVIVLSGTSFILIFSLFTWLFLLPIYMKSLGAEDFHIGVSYSLFGLGYTVAQFLGGYLSDRFGRKYLIVIPTWLFSVLYLFMALSNNWIQVAILYLLISISSAFQSPSFTSIIAESVEEGKIGFGFGTFELLIMVGISLGPLAGSVFIEMFSIRELIIGSAIASLIAAILRQLGLIEPVKRQEKKLMKFTLGRNQIWFIIAGSLMFLSLSFTINGPFMTLYQEEILGLEESEINLLFGIAGIPSAVLCLVAGWLTDKLGGKEITAVSIVIHAASAFLWAYFSGNLLFLTLSFIFVQFFYVSYQTVIAKITTEENRARFTGLFGTISGLVSSIGPYMGMYVKLHSGYLATFLLCLIISVVSSVLLSKLTA